MLSKKGALLKIILLIPLLWNSNYYRLLCKKDPLCTIFSLTVYSYIFTEMFVFFFLNHSIAQAYDIAENNFQSQVREKCMLK